MKATGVVRRVDDLGRIVIPKEIRRTLRIREGDPLEIYTDRDGEVIFKKYSPMGDLQDLARQMCESMEHYCRQIPAVADRDSMIALGGGAKKSLLDKSNSAALEKMMEQRQHYCWREGETTLYPVEGEERFRLGAVAPILCQGDLMGSVMLLLDEKSPAPEEADLKLIRIMADFLGKQMEN